MTITLNIRTKIRKVNRISEECHAVNERQTKIGRRGQSSFAKHMTKWT